MKKYGPIFLLFIFAVSCTSKNITTQNSTGIKVIEAKGIWQNPDKFAKPQTLSAGKPILVAAGKPTITPTNLNIHIAGQPKISIAGTPKVIIPGTDTFLLPKTIATSGKVRRAGLPEIIVAKDMASKDQNPANFSFFKILQGLKHNNIRCMLQDKTGNFWFGTNAGICRYDGKFFTNYTDIEGLANNFVISILEDKTGNLWFGTYGGGVSRYDGKFFTNFTEKEGLANNFVISILEDKTGNLWFGTEGGGVSCYDGKSFTNFTEKEGLTNNFVISILEDKTGNLWFGTYGGASRFNGESFTNFTDKDGLSNNVVSNIVEDKTGNIWFGTFGGGVCRYDGKSFANYTENEGLANNFVLSILEDKIGNLWFGTNGGGISRYDGNSFTNFTDKDGLPNNFVLSILEDKTGNIWLGTDGGGVSRYDGKFFNIFTDKEGLANNVVYGILEDKTGNLWFGTNGGGVSRYDGKSFANFTENEGLANNFLFNILEDKTGNLWFCTNGGGVSRYDGKFFANFTNTEGLADNVVNNILQDKTGNLWFCTNGGVSRYDGKSFTNFTEKEGLANNFVLSILEDKMGNLWFGTYGGGVSCYDGKSFTNFTKKEGLADNFILSILEDKLGNIWFGTENGGVSHYDGKSFTTFTDKEGLANNAVLSLLQDKEGNIWFGTRKGLSRIASDRLLKLNEKNHDFNSIKEALFYNYGYNDGFLGLNCRRNSVFQDSKGRIWWGTDVLTCYTPEGDIIDRSAPIVQINNIKLFSEEIAWANLGAVSTDSTGKEFIKGKSRDTTLGNGVILHDIKFDGITKWYSLPQNLSLPYDNNNLTFNFIGIHQQNHNHIKYQYKLQGLEENWSSISENTEASYGNLPSGDYVFKVKAMNQSGIWSKVFEYEFSVRPPWWQTWLFRITVIIFTLLCIWFYIKRRERKLKAEKEILEQIVKERTAEVIEKQKEIVDSINYAQRIQRALLASDKLLKNNLKDYFIFFQPKDIVSGDFYWAAELENKQFALVTADSTGHGVPGAIMSMLNISCLKEAVEAKNLVEPNEILDYTRKKIIETLLNDGSKEGGRDGMDCSLISFDVKNNKLSYSAANNPIWIVREAQILEFVSDKMPVGKHERDNVPFSQHTIDLRDGDMVYSITDGMPDQFGGPKGKKFMYKPLKELLISIANLPMQEQKEKLTEVLNNWKGNLEQVDDVCIIGVRV